METRDVILTVARRLFLQHGYTATSMRQIAEESLIGKATIYHHFVDKEAILITLVEQSMARMHASLVTVRQEEEPQPRLRLATLISLEYLLDSAGFIQIARREVPGTRDQIQKEFFTFFHKFLNILEETLAAGIERKIFRPLNPSEGARALMAMIQGNFAMYYLTGEPIDSPEQIVDGLLDIYYKGILADNSISRQG